MMRLQHIAYTVARALKAARAYSFPASSIPVFVGAAFAGAADRFDATWLAWLIITWLGATLLHAGCNLINDYYDWSNEIDDEHVLRSSAVSGDEKVLMQVHIGGLLCLGLGCSIGMYIALKQHWSIYLIGAIGLVIAYFYTAKPLGLKYRALGEVAVFLGMGPLMVAGAYAAARGDWTGPVVQMLLASLLVGLMVTAILYANNLRDFFNDSSKGFRTLPMLLGAARAPWFYYALVGSAYAVPIAMSVAFTNLWWLLPILSAPLEAGIVRRVARGFPSQLQHLLNIDVACAQVHLAYGLLLIAAIVMAV